MNLICRRVVTAVLAGTMTVGIADACTRGLFVGENGSVITLRSMDWKNDIGTNLWVFQRGMERRGAADPDSITSTSEFGSVFASAFDVGTADGMNEAGLVANLLYLSDSVCPEAPPAEGSKPMSIAA